MTGTVLLLRDHFDCFLRDNASKKRGRVRELCGGRPCTKQGLDAARHTKPTVTSLRWRRRAPGQLNVLADNAPQLLQQTLGCSFSGVNEADRARVRAPAANAHVITRGEINWMHVASAGLSRSNTPTAYPPQRVCGLDKQVSGALIDGRAQVALERPASCRAAAGVSCRADWSVI